MPRAPIRRTRDEYRAESIFWVPREAGWGRLKAQARQAIIGQLIEMISNIKVGDEDARSQDVLGRVYQFASAEGNRAASSILRAMSTIVIMRADAQMQYGALE